jgi:hypothetical protein
MRIVGRHYGVFTPQQRFGLDWLNRSVWGSITHTPAQLADGGFQIANAEQTCARDKSIRAGAGAVGTGRIVDAAVHADAVG